MCGIVGYGGKANGFDVAALVACRDALSHRGPDDAGYWISEDARVALGHRRLAIVDLSAAGAQPMRSSSGDIGIVFNGEIYNHGALREELRARGHSFRGHSDTEVIIAAFAQWGVACFDRLRGMFALCIHDVRADRLILARDRAGEKPLYWARHRGGIMFASEMKALFADESFPRRLDPDGLDAYLAYGYVPGELCLVAGVRKIPAGHFLEVSLSSGAVRSERYWDLPKPAPVAASDEPALVEELEHLLRASVKEQLEADVPVAVLLSGGIDSSLVTACAALASSGPVRTFTVGFHAEAYDERKHAARIAKHFGCRHTELEIEASAMDLLPQLARHYDEPIADSSMIPTFLLSRLVSQEVKVVLGGDAGDELFGGYRAYQGSLRLEQARAALPQAVRSAISGASGAMLPPGFPNRNALVGLSQPFEAGVARVGLMFDGAMRRRLAPWLAGRSTEHEAEAWKLNLVEPERGVPGTFMAADFRSYLTEDILVKVDRASMANSLEVRAPFLDHRIVEFAFSKVPNALRASRTERKILLKRLAARLLPADFDATRKQGFSVPLSDWMDQGYRSRWCDLFESQYGEVFDFAVVRALLQSQQAGGVGRVFGLLLLMHWLRAYRIAI